MAAAASPGILTLPVTATKRPLPSNAARSAAAHSAGVTRASAGLNNACSSAGVVNTSRSTRPPAISLARPFERRVGAVFTA
jgi:hypothetical protein